MIYDYAIQPEALVAINGLWQRHADLGVSSGRVIAEVPGESWRESVSKQLDAFDPAIIGTQGYRKLEDWLCNLAKNGTLRRRPQESSATATADWIATVCAENQRLPFRAIVSNNKGLFPGCDNVINKTDIDLAHERWQVPRSVEVRRQINSIAAVMKPLATLSHDLLFVDPFFARRTDAFGAIAKIIAEAQNATFPLRYVEVHTEVKESQTMKCAKQNIRDTFPEMMHHFGVKKEKWKLTVRIRSRLHDRFLMTDLGGISLSAGFDDAVRRPTQIATLLEEQLWLNRQMEYNTRDLEYVKSKSDRKAICGAVEDELEIEY
jgi:hypothetical protein